MSPFIGVYSGWVKNELRYNRQKRMDLMWDDPARRYKAPEYLQCFIISVNYHCHTNFLLCENMQGSFF